MSRGATVVCTALLLLGVATVGAAADTATISVTDAEAAPGDRVTVDIEVVDASDVASYQLNLTFDPAVVQVDSIEGGDFDDPISNVANDAGWLRISQAAAEGTAEPTLATITFVVVGEPGDATQLSFVPEDTLIAGSMGDTIPTDLSGGRIVVAGSSATTTTTTAAAGTTATTIDGTPSADEDTVPTTTDAESAATDTGTPTDASGGGSDGGGSTTVPGFTLVGALVALLLLGLIGRRHR